MKNGALIFFSTERNLKNLIKYPVKFIIHLFTGSGIEHVGIHCDGYFYEALYPTVKRTPILTRLNNLPRYTKVSILAPIEDLDESKTEALRKDLDHQIGKRYGSKLAIYSALDRVLFMRKWLGIEKSNKKTFCSKLCFIAWQKLCPVLLSEFNPSTNRCQLIDPNTVNPEELKKIMLNSGLLKEV